MTKSDLIGEVSKSTGLSKRAAEEAVDAAVDAMKKAIKKNGECRYPGFGTFRVKKRAARMGINPRTGEKIKIKASKTVGFKPAAAFKEKL